jgi:hypothetical protein
MPKTETEQLTEALTDLADAVDDFCCKLGSYKQEVEGVKDEDQGLGGEFPKLAKVSAEELLRELLDYSQRLHREDQKATDVLNRMTWNRAKAGSPKPEPKRLPPAPKTKKLPQPRKIPLLTA